MSMQATTGPTPNSSVSVVPAAATAAAMRRLESRDLVVEAAQIVEVLEATA